MTMDDRPVPATKMEDVPKGEEEPISFMDPTEELLAYNPKKELTAEVDMSPMFQTPWVVRALDNETNEKLLEEASHFKRNPRTGQQVRDLNNAEYSKLMIYHCTVKPDLKDPRIAKKYNLKGHQHTRIVDSVLFLPGFVDRVASKIMDLSGYQEQMVEVAKNSSGKEA